MERDRDYSKSRPRDSGSFLGRLLPVGLVVLVLVVVYIQHTSNVERNERVEALLQKSVQGQKTGLERMTELYEETVSKLNYMESKFGDLDKAQHRVATKFDALESGQDLVSAKLEGIATKLGSQSIFNEKPKQKECPVETDGLPTFYEIAVQEGTDKVSTHQYHHLYDKYLPELRKKPIRMMEIGLGCDMKYGPGKSLHVWRRYFEPNGVELHFVELDRECASLWAEKMRDVNVHIGDQGNRTFLLDLAKKVGPGFDLIIDDGGHFMEMQQISLEILFDIVKPGGYYVIEDLQTSFIRVYHDPKFPTTIEVLKTYMDAFYVGVGLDAQPTTKFPPFTKDIRSFECFHEACIFHKKE